MKHGSCTLCGSEQRVRLFVKTGWTFLRCRRCGLVSLDPLPSAADLEAHHERSYREGRYAAFAAASVRADIACARLTALRPLAPPGPWLDVGCSTGAFLAEAARAGMVAEGIELSAVAVAQARAGGFTVHQGSVETFIPSRRYAVVTAFDVLEHLPDPWGLVRQVNGWLQPDGLFVLTVPNAASLPARLMGRRWFYYTAPDHVHYFTPATLRRLLETVGFHGIAIRRAWKPLTLEYGAAQLVHFNPQLGRLLGALMRLLPRSWRVRPYPLPLGEMLVTARPSSSTSPRPHGE